MSEDIVATTQVRHFRQILLWPLQLIPSQDDTQIQKGWEVFENAGSENPWRELSSEFTGDQTKFQRRHYFEFMTFLPHVQRFLYGEGVAREPSAWHSESPVRVFRRNDIAGARVTYSRDAAPVTFEVGHVELYFFFDIDVVLLAVEVYADNLSLARVQETIYGLGRAFPLDWEPDGSASHCLDRVEWLSRSGQVLAASDFEQSARYLEYVSQFRAPRIGSHWEFLLKPLVPNYSGEPGAMRYRHIEYHRMPLMAYLAVDDPRSLSRADFVRLGLATAPGPSDTLPLSRRYLLRFEQRYCYDRYWCEQAGNLTTRFVCCGPTMIVVGSAGNPNFIERETGMLGQFRHQYLLLFLIVHFHRAALLMLSDRLVIILNRLDIHNPEKVRQFKRAIRQVFEVFLRFTHRYWFHNVSDHIQTRELFRICSENLDTERLFNEVREEIQDMSTYLDSDTLRRQSNSMIRLTVTTIFGMILTVTTGFLGMNLIAEGEAPMMAKILYFAVVALPCGLFALITIGKSRRLSDLLDALADERLSARAKYIALENVFRKRMRSVR